VDDEEEEEEVEKEEEDQQEWAFSLMSTITDDKREAIRLLLGSLSYALDEVKVSYAQLKVRINADSSISEGIAEEARAAGTSVTVK
jgi:hypothetical protein